MASSSSTAADLEALIGGVAPSGGHGRGLEVSHLDGFTPVEGGNVVELDVESAVFVFDREKRLQNMLQESEAVVGLAGWGPAGAHMGVLALHVAAGGAAGGFEPGLGRGTVTRLEGLEAGVLEIARLPKFDEGTKAGGGGAFQFFG